MTKNFEIGQVIYILSEQTQHILPGIVAEEVVVKKLTGNNTSWKIKVGQGDRSKLFDSAKIRGEVYGSLEEIRDVMTNRLTEYVNKLTSEASERVEKWYGKEISDRQKAMLQAATGANQQSTFDDRIDPELLLNSLENTPVSTTPKFTNDPKLDPRATLRDNLRNMALDPILDEPQDSEGQMFIQGPNGEKIAVKINKPRQPLS